MHRNAEVLDLGERLLTAYPDLPQGDVVLDMMITAAIRLDEFDRARDLALGFPERFGASERRDPAMTTTATVLAEAERPADAVLVLAALAGAQTDDPDALRTTLEAAEPLLGRLDDPVLQALAVRLADSPLEPALARGLADRRLVAGPTVGGAEPGRIGVLGPLTGRYARFGNAFQAGVRQASIAADPAGTSRWELVLEDTEGDPVAAALAAQRLCREQRCELVIGALLSSTTATAALVTDRYGVPLISPTATNERLGLLGPNVLQSNLTGPVEAGILARLASEVLLKDRFAIIRPDTPEGASLAAAFAAEVTAHGDTLLIEAVFDPSATDFRSQVRAVRELRPEVLFVPATVDQMVLLGPQIDFFKVGALLLGPSEWNSSRLMQKAGSVLERALCTASEVVYPAAWSVDFAADWPADQYDEESSRLARSAYLATRLVLHTMQADTTADPRTLAERLRDNLTGREVSLAGPESYAATVRMVEGSALAPFPGRLYNEAWLRQTAADNARADSLATVAVDTATTMSGDTGAVTPPER